MNLQMMRNGNVTNTYVTPIVMQAAFDHQEGTPIGPPTRPASPILESTNEMTKVKDLIEGHSKNMDEQAAKRLSLTRKQLLNT